MAAITLLVGEGWEKNPEDMWGRSRTTWSRILPIPPDTPCLTPLSGWSSPFWICQCDGTSEPPPQGRGRGLGMGPGPGTGRRQFADRLELTPTFTLSKHKPTCPATLSDPRLTPDKICCGSGLLHSRDFFGTWGFLEMRDFFGVRVFFGLWGRSSRVLFLRGGPGEAPAAIGVVSSSQYRRGF